MKLNKIEKSFLNLSGNIYDSEFINLINIKDEKIALDNNTMFLNDEIKNILNLDTIKKYQNCVFIFEQNGVWGIVCDVPICEYNQKNIKNHELVIPETVQGMLSNFYGYNGEAAPTLLLHENKINLEKIIKKGNYKEKHLVSNISLYIYEDEFADDIIYKYKNIEKMFIGDGHHRMYTTSLTDFKDKVLSCIISIEDVNLLPIHRMITNVSDEEFDLALNFIKNKLNIVRCCKEDKVKKGFVKLSFKNDCFLVKLIDLNSDAFWNNDVYRLNTQIIGQAFRIFDFSRIIYISPFENIESKNDNVLLELSELSKEEFVNTAKSNSVLPPKSTWMSYKFPSLLIMSLYQ